MKTVILIPARYHSSRFPGKPLIPLLGKPMILWVVGISAKAIGSKNVYVVTDDKRISAVCESAGVNCLMTDSAALTGTDRIAEAAQQVSADIYINVQGDEPLVNPSDILEIQNYKIRHMDSVVNGYCRLADNENPDNVNIPKVVTNEKNRMLYMSRRAIPGYKDSSNAPDIYKKQVCIYAFTKKELDAFRNYGRKSTLESCEDIEILRYLELGIPVLMVETSGGSLAVDVPEDVKPVEAVLQEAVSRGFDAI